MKITRYGLLKWGWNPVMITEFVASDKPAAPILPQLAKMENAKSISLSNSGLQYIDLNNHPKLECLYVCGNHLTSLPGIEHCPSMQVLWATGNQMEQAEWQRIIRALPAGCLVGVEDSEYLIKAGELAKNF